MNDGDLGVLEVVGQVLAGDAALLVVTAAGAESVPQAAFGENRVGCGRRDFENTVFGVNFRGRNGNAGVEVTDNEFHAVSNEFVGNRNTLLGVGYVVAQHDLDLLAIDAAGGIDVFRSLFGTLLDLSAKSSIRAGQRCADSDHDIGPGRTAKRDHGGQRNSGKKRLLHYFTPSSFGWVDCKDLFSTHLH